MEAIQFIQTTPAELAGLITEAVKMILPTIKSDDDDKLMNAKAAADYMGVSEGTILRWKKAKKITAYAHEGIVRYKKYELNQLLKALK